jgi:integrase
MDKKAPEVRQRKALAEKIAKMTERPAIGVRQTKHGWAVFAKVRGEYVSKHFPRDTALSVLVEARKNMVATAQLGLTQTATDASLTFAADVKTYLKAKAGLPTLTDRTQRIEWWRDQLGRTRARDSVTSVEIRRHLEAKRKAGAKPGTLNVYRTALMDFYTVLNGPSGSNPVRDVPKYHEQELSLQLPSREAAIRAVDHAIHRKQPRARGTKSQARLRVLLWTGWPSKTLKKLRPADIKWAESRVLLHGRDKGGGTKPCTLPILPQAMEALKAFADLNAWGAFSGSALHSTLHRGCDAAGVTRFRVYDLRHLFGTELVANSHDERGTAELMLHTSPQQTWRYSRQAASTRAVSALEAMKAALPMSPQAKPRLVKKPRLRHDRSTK